MLTVVFLLPVLAVSTMAYAGVVATDMTFSLEVPDFIIHSSDQPVPVVIDVTINMDPNGGSVSGICLWKVNMFGSRNTDGSGEREPSITQILNINEIAIPLNPSGPLYFKDVLVNFDMLKVGCGDIGYLCLEFTQCDSPSPDFSFKTSDGEDALVKCQDENCRAVIIRKFKTKPIFINLVEGRRANPVSFNAVAFSTNKSGTVPKGHDLWTVSLWGSKESNGRGLQRWGFQQQVLMDPYYASIPLINPGDKIDISSVVTQFDMIGSKCADVPYLCATFNRNPYSDPPFVMEAAPDESVLTHCFPVPDEACRGVIATGLDFNMDFEIVPGAPDVVTFDIDVSTFHTSAGAEGTNLWRVGLFTSPDSVGSSKLIDVKQILTDTQSSTALKPGDALRLDNVNVKIDLTGLVCEESTKYICLEFGKEENAIPDFEFEVSGGGNLLIKCLEQKCE